MGRVEARTLWLKEECMSQAWGWEGNWEVIVTGAWWARGMVARNNLVGCRLTTNSVGSLNWGKSHGLILKQWFTIEGFQVQTRLVWLEWHVFQGSSGCSGLYRWEWDKDGHKEAASEAFTTWGMVRAHSGRWERAWKQGKWFFSRKNQGNLVMDWELGVSKRETLWSMEFESLLFL